MLDKRQQILDVDRKKYTFWYLIVLRGEQKKNRPSEIEGKRSSWEMRCENQSKKFSKKYTIISDEIEMHPTNA